MPIDLYPPVEVLKTVTTTTSRFELRSDGIVARTALKDGPKFHYTKHVDENLEALQDISPDKKRPLLCYLSDRQLSKEAALKYGSVKFAKAMAYVAGNEHQEIISKVMIHFSKLKMPVKIFHNEKEAIAWLRTFSS